MSSGSESDEDYVPKEQEQLSEEESADDETEKQYDAEVDHKSKKRKVAQGSKGKKKSKKVQVLKETKFSPVPNEENELVAEEKINPEEEKKREDDLWAKFLEGTDNKPKPKETTITKNIVKGEIKEDIPQTNAKLNDDVKQKERRIFEFAGETIIVENNVIKEKIKKAETSVDTNNQNGPSQVPVSSKSGGKSGLSNILGQLNKKNKLSTLEKSKLDWTTYKQEEGIEEEIQSHNKGKQGFLDRRDFLERADLREYEIERDLRINRRSNR